MLGNVEWICLGSSLRNGSDTERLISTIITGGQGMSLPPFYFTNEEILLI